MHNILTYNAGWKTGTSFDFGKQQQLNKQDQFRNDY